MVKWLVVTRKNSEKSECSLPKWVSTSFFILSCISDFFVIIKHTQFSVPDDVSVAADEIQMIIKCMLNRRQHF